MSENLAPIVLFVYNRPWHTVQTLEALSKNTVAHKSKLYIFSDGPKKNAPKADVDLIHEVRKILRIKSWCKEVQIVESTENKGLAVSIVQGVTSVIGQFGKIIVLEDDIVTSKGFLRFMNDALNVYEHNEYVMHVSGYMYPLNVKLPDTVFLNVVTPWGWATWQRAWIKFEFDALSLKERLLSIPNLDLYDYNRGYGNEFYNQLIANVEGRISTWAVKWHTVIYLARGFCLHAGKSMTANIGFDGSGENCGIEEGRNSDALSEYLEVRTIRLSQLPYVLKAFHKFYLNSTSKSKVKKISFNKKVLRRIHRLLKRLYIFK